MTANEMRTRAVEYMTGRKGKNSYTQGAKRKYFFGYPDNQIGNTAQTGFSDCSSAVRKAIQAASGIDIGSNTSAQINNRNTIGRVVDETDGAYPDETKLKIGDCLYFKGNSGHPLDVGHVEMYTGKNECYGHGSGKGPTKKNLRAYCKSRAGSKKRYFMAVRWILDAISPEHSVILAEGKWHVRSGPGLEYADVGVARGGEALEKIEIGDWVPVLYHGEVRFIGPQAVKK